MRPSEWLGERFWPYVYRVEPFGCWWWMGRLTMGGYGILSIEGRPKWAHHLAWMITRGSLRNLLVLHKCDHPACVNPHHLYLGTTLNNHEDAISRGRKFRLDFDEDDRVTSNIEYRMHCLAELLLDEDLRDPLEVTALQTARRSTR